MLVNKKVYKKFRNKSLANKKLLYILFLDFLIIEANARTLYNLATKTNRNKNINNKKNQKEKKTLYNRVALKLEQIYKKIN